mmetsp:Transcript_14273/g.27710  ORF Transcript_14273/g.27710 Transcript_14273/m.27710 type:complete len:285 (-) Transcript_14273:113-967(-)|eukprot:CAMPEP_0171501570 /NCGR_PEP_ID=MMETSP0958-20121227/9635_1 /TAXON_ID=87120 /ORGANISM="Aurantiochytrium limacinum, Strain ATCCMYA-1381" /LENGTH=284 /DNA_ID=CAMNT_0012036407 /DNA_START=98 /DNA_END=952 /DNA_ORIENTATION=+
MERQQPDFVARVIGAATQGAAGAVVGAVLSATTEPVVNRVLVKRQTLKEALAEVDLETVQKFFSTVVAANFIKFPFFEVVNILVGDLDLPDTAKGAVLGAVFTTATLPIGNYRFCKSMGMPVDVSSLYKAYLPTVARDVVYGVVRQTVGTFLAQNYPGLFKSVGGRFIATFITVLAACVISAPGNEVRGYYLQPEDRRLPVKEFFKPDRFIRSTTIGGLIMSSALGVGSLVVGPATVQFNAFKALLDANPVAKVMVGIFVAQQYLAAKRHADLLDKLDNTKKSA